MEEFLPYKIDPKCGNLFRQVLSKLEPDFVCIEVQEQAKKSNIKWKESVQKYFKNYILMENVMKAVNGIKNSDTPKFGLTNESAQDENDLSVHPMYFKMLEEHLSLQNTDDHMKFFNSEHSYFSNKMQERKFNKEEIKKFSNETESNIQIFCKRVVEYVACSNYIGINMRKAFSETMKFLSSKAILLDPNYNLTINSSLDEMLCTYNKELRESLSILKDILELSLKKIQNENEYTELFTKDCEMLFEKIRTMELQYTADTYGEKKVKALSIIKSQMRSKEASLRKEHTELSSMLAEYHVLGPHYRELVEEYSRLKKNLLHLDWAVDNMKQKQELSVLQGSVNEGQS